jgi:molybdenum cofactor biosynthesis protein A
MDKSKMIIDQQNRVHNYLRISLTEKCNLRCTYCMPAEGVKLSPRKSIMNAQEVFEIAQKFVEAGVTKIRLTGGEPLVRKDIKPIIEQLSTLNVSIGISSNGILIDRFIPELIKAKIKNINISLDTLNRQKFQDISRFDKLSQVLSNIDLLINKGFNVKINVVLMKGFNDDEIIDLIALSKHKSIAVRFIEFMPFDGNAWDENKVVSEKEILEKVSNHYSSENVVKLADGENETAHNYKIKDHLGQFGIISTVSNPFCDSCNRIRLTANGKIKNCLFSSGETDLLSAFRDGQDITPLIHKNIAEKQPSRGGLDLEGSFLNPTSHVNRSMILIGG